jgi:AraC-like DNA-binding protein
MRTPKWVLEIGMPPRTLTRHFEHEVGMSLRIWRQRLRLFKAIELLGSDLPITEIALHLAMPRRHHSYSCFARE